MGVNTPAKIIDVNAVSYLYGKLKGNIDTFQDASQTAIEQFKLDAQTDIDAAVANANAKAAAAQDAADSANNLVFEANSTYATKTELNAAISKITSFEMTIVDALPDKGQKGYIYLILASDGSGNDIYDEYIWIPDKVKFEKIGTTRVDLSPYAKSADVADVYETKNAAAVTYLSKTSAADTYLSKDDAASTYESKTDLNADFLKKTDAANTYVTQTAYDEKVAALEQADADTLTAAKKDALANYVQRSTYSEKVAELETTDTNNLAEAKSYADTVSANALRDAKADAADTYVTKTAYDTKMTALSKADTDNLSTAKSYADTVGSNTLSSAKSYADGVGSDTLDSAKSYADTVSANALASAKTNAADTYVTKSTYNSKVSALETADTNNLSTAKSYADTVGSNTLSSAKSYADTVGKNTLDSAKTYVNTAVGKITSFELSVVSSLPSTGVKGTIYLVNASNGSGNDVYDEYIWIPGNSKFEKIGTTRIDLTPYAKTADVASGYLAKTATAAAATKLATARTINGTSFDGTGNITTANWGTARNIYISDSDGTNTSAAVPVNGGGNATLKLPATIKASLSGNASTASSAAKCTGNAATATKLATARNIALSGAVTGNANFDGSGNITISTSVNHSHNYAGSSSAGGAANSAVKLATARNIALTGAVTGNANFDGSGNISIATSVNHTHNYAGSSSAGGAANSLAYFKCTSTSNVGVDDTTANAIGYVNGISLLGQADGALYKQTHSSPWAHEIYGDYRTGQICLRGKNNGTWQGWRTVLDSSNYTGYTVTKTGGGASGTWGISVTGSSASCTGNAATATKLATARNIALTGAVTGNVNFDGSGNISIATSVNHGHDYLPLSGGTMRGPLNFANGVWNVVGDDVAIGDHNVGGGLGVLGRNDNTKINLCQYGNPSNFKSISFDGSTLYMDGNCNYSSSSGNAAKLATARNIAISGAVTGNANFDGSGNITISTSVNHSHNYAGSSSAGGAANSATKLATARTIALGNALSGSVSFNGTSNVTISAKVNKGTSAPSSLAEGSVYFVYEA